MARTSKATADVPDQPPAQPALNELDPTLSFICRDLVGLADDYPSVLALRGNGILSPWQLITATDEAIEDFEYTPIGSKTSQPMMSVHRATIKWIRDWSFHLANEPGKHCVNDEQWREIDKSQFMDFVVMMRTGKFSALSRPSAELVVKSAANKIAEFK